MVGNVSGGLIGLETVIGALTVKVVPLFEMTTGTDTIGNVPPVLLGTLRDKGIDAVKVVKLLATVMGTDTTDTVEGVAETGFVSVVDADSEAWELGWPVERLTETAKVGIIDVVEESADCPVLDDA